MNQSKKITDGALLTAVYIVLLLLVLFIPFIFMLGIFILPIPFVIYASRYNWKPTLVMMMAAIVISLLFATVFSLPVTILVSLGGTLIGTAIHKNLKAYETWARGTLGFIIGLIVVLFILQFTLNINIYQVMDDAIQETIGITTTMMQQMGLNPDSVEEMQIIEDQMHAFKDLLPSSIAIFSIVLAFVSQWASYRVINRIENKRLSFPAFKDFNLPMSIIWIYFFSLLFSLFDLGEGSNLDLVIVNVVAVTIALITIQGFSFIFFYADLKHIHKSIPIIIVVITLLIPFLFMFIIRIIGIIDLGFNLKSRLVNANHK